MIPRLVHHEESNPMELGSDSFKCKCYEDNCMVYLVLVALG